MPRLARHLLMVGLALVAAACASSARAPRLACEVSEQPGMCEGRRLLSDTTLYRQLARLSAELDSIMSTTGARRLIPDPALQAELTRLLADTTFQAQARRLLADTTLYAHLAQLTQELDSLLARRSRERGTTPRR